MIPQDFIEEVQQKTDIVDLISSYIPLKRAGKNFKAQCPFHNEKTPSFFVNPQKQIFHCFGCGEGGNALRFVMLYDRLTFVEAVEVLAKRLGMRVPYEKVSGRDRIKTVLYDVMQEAARFYHKNLLPLDEASAARNYLKERGIREEIIKSFRIGYAPQNDMLIKYMRKRGTTLDILEKASLAVARDSGGYRDLFWGRVMFPIYDVRSRVVGFGARRIGDNKNAPKYINSPENLLYRKREHLFGLNFSKDEIIKKDSVIVTEGYMDMITPFAAGIKNIVASLGTALTTEQIRTIKRYTNNIILIFDSDKAGQNATLRAIDLLIESGLNISVVRMPEGLDLDLAVRERGADFTVSLLNKKVDFFDYKIGILRSLYRFDSIEGKVNIANQMLSTISKLSSEVEKYEYIKKLSDILDVKEAVLFDELKKINKGKNSSGTEDKSYVERKFSGVPMTERIIIRTLFSNGRVITAIKNRISADDFSHPLARRVFSLVMDKEKLEEKFSCNSFLSSVQDEEVSNFVSQVMMENMGTINKDVLKDCILKLKRNRAKAVRSRLRNQIREAENSKDENKVKNLMSEFQKINSEVRND